jgi:AAA+ ATPase superfamily predicted ATPase
MLILFKVFVNRNDEFNYLDSAYCSDRSEFIVIYGRRRIWKKELLREFIKNKNAVCFLADERSDQDNLSDFRTLVGGVLIMIFKVLPCKGVG